MKVSKSKVSEERFFDNELIYNPKVVKEMHRAAAAHESVQRSTCCKVGM